MVKFTGSNAVIKSSGARHWVEVDGVQLTGMTKVDVHYEHGDIVTAQITILNPQIDNRAKRED